MDVVRSTAEARKAVALCARLAGAGEFGVELLIALRLTIALAENDSDAIYMREVGGNVLTSLITPRVIAGGRRDD